MIAKLGYKIITTVYAKLMHNNSKRWEKYYAKKTYSNYRA
jgi:hypothetical protein